MWAVYGKPKNHIQNYRPVHTILIILRLLRFTLVHMINDHMGGHCTECCCTLNSKHRTVNEAQLHSVHTQHCLRCTVAQCPDVQSGLSLTGAASLCQTPWPHQRPSKRGKAKKIKNLKILPPLTSHQGQNISPTKTLKGEDQRLKHQQHIFSAKEEIVTRPPPRRGQSFICIVLKPGSQRPTKEKFRCQEIRLGHQSWLMNLTGVQCMYSVHLQLYQELFRFHEFPCFKSLRPSSSSSSPSSAANAYD